METFALVVGCFAAGLIARNIEPRTVKLSGWLNKLIINFILPAIVLSTVPNIEFDSNALFLMFAPWAGCLIFVPLCIWIAARLGFDREQQGALILLSILGNTAFLGIGMVRSFLGDNSVPDAVLYDQLGSFIILATLGTAVIAIYSPYQNTNTRVSALTILRKIVLFPPFISLVVGLCLPSTDVFGFSIDVLKWIGGSIVPMALIVIGLQLELRVDPKQRTPMLCILGLKMILLPVLTLLAAISLNIEQTQFDVAVFQAAMPPMVTPAIMLIEAKIAPKLTASVLGIGTLVGFITLPLWAYFLTNII